MTLIDLLYVSNFKGGYATINEPEEIITVDREKNNESVFNRLESENLNNWLSDYTIGDLWQKNVIKGQP